MMYILDTLKVADIVIFLMSSEEEVDSFGESCLSAIKTQGVPTVFAFVQHLETNDQKQQLLIRRSLTEYIQHHFPSSTKVFSCGNQQDCLKSTRLMNARLQNIAWRDRHSYMIADDVAYEAQTESLGTLKVSGFIRGAPLSANSLVHLPNYGDFQIEKVVNISTSNHHKKNEMELDEDCVLDVSDPALQESLVAENIPDAMEGEQTWPTEQELKDADERVQGLNEKKKKRWVPKGTSSYQAAWIVDSDEEDEGTLNNNSESFDTNEDMMMDVPEANGEVDWASLKLGHTDNALYESEEELEEIDIQEKENMFDDAFNQEDEETQLEKYLEIRKKCQEDMEFPDEVDTPRNEAARVRFQKYRGLKSFRTSPWDSYENLPVDYSKIFQFQNFKRYKQKVFDNIGKNGVSCGHHVTIYIKNVPSAVIENINHEKIFMLFSLLPNERKMSTLNFVVNRTKDYSEPIKSKDEMLLMCGFRRFVVQPIYSSHTKGGTNNVHKFERFLQMGRSTVATIYAPIQYGPAPILMFKYSENGMNFTPVNTTPFVAVGSVMDVDPTRIIAKRLCLTGHPFKVHKRTATIRFMFFSPEDIEYFKPVQLTTKMGRVGHIKESLGTHGYMKCVFDGALNGQDTVCMNLYKRVFPKWTTYLYCHKESADMQIDEMKI